jgi:phosphoribosylaminoimidazole-succinocarboxamide synthase
VTTESLDLPLLSTGKVRDMYDLGDRILMVASDRISTYDVVHPNLIPGKGAVLAGISVFWFGLTGDIVPNHLVSATEDVPDSVRGNALTVRKLRMLPVECVVRGYLAGSGWKEYQADGTVCGIPLPAGLRESDRLPEPIFTPATKAEIGEHDENIDFEAAVLALDGIEYGNPAVTGGRALAEQLRDISIALYERASDHAREHGIILADTKFEFGLDEHGVLTLGDEVLTPDSSRFWPADRYEPGRAQDSFDKQTVRDWATATGWNKSAPAPTIAPEIVERTRELYLQTYERITGEPFQAWLDRVGATDPALGSPAS